jgi:stearoyl-CoA desaturase (delta-9 desaturase)
MVILCFFVGHWVLSVFMQSFFLHRYGAHRMFSMSKGWERFFHLLTYLAQGASYLNPRAYALLHRLHHAHSDTRKDPHSPQNHDSFFDMMWATKKRYEALRTQKEYLDARFVGGYPEWPLMDKFGEHRASTAFWVLFYIGVYAVFATHWWMWLLLPAHFLMGPIHGAIVNWGGHMYGYRNYKVSDGSKNSLPFDFLTMGELFQNNHHRFGLDPNFAKRWFELDPTYVAIRAMSAVGIIKLAGEEQHAVAHDPGAADENVRIKTSFVAHG